MPRRWGATNDAIDKVKTFGDNGEPESMTVERSTSNVFPQGSGRIFIAQTYDPSVVPVGCSSRFRDEVKDEEFFPMLGNSFHPKSSKVDIYAALKRYNTSVFTQNKVFIHPASEEHVKVGLRPFGGGMRPSPQIATTLRQKNTS